MSWEPRIAAYIPGEARQNCFGPILDTVTADETTYIAYGALAGIVLCDHKLNYLETLRIQDAFPSRDQGVRSWPVHGLRCISEDGEARILAWSGKHAVIWLKKAGKTMKDTWSIWSSLTFEQEIVSMDYRAYSLLMSSAHDVRLMKSASHLQVPVWESLVSFPAKQATQCCLSPSATFMAWASINGNDVFVAAIPRDTARAKAALPQSLRHRRPLTNIFWRDSSGQDDFYLYTTTIDGAFRLFTVMEDDPSWFQLAASGSTTDIGQVQAMLRGGSPAEQTVTSAQPFVACGVDEKFAESLGNPSRAKRDNEEVLGHDHVMWIDRRGKLSRTVLKGLSRRPPRAISVVKNVGPSKVPLLQDLAPDCTPVCQPSKPCDNRLDVAVSINSGSDSNALVSRRINLRTGETEDLGQTVDTKGGSETVAQSLFAHLPLDNVSVDQNHLIFEDGAHYHTLTSNSEKAGWKIASTRKSTRAGIRDIFVPLAQQPSVLAMSADVITFGTGMAGARTLSIPCPSELSAILQSDARMEHVVGSATPQSAIVYILHLSSAAEPQTWRIKLDLNQDCIQIRHLAAAEGSQEALQQIRCNGGKLVNKRLSQIGDLNELRLTFSRNQEIMQFRISIENQQFRVNKEFSISDVGVEPTQVFSNADAKLATISSGKLKIWDTVSTRFGSGLELISDEIEPVAACAFAQEHHNTLAYAAGARVVVLCLNSRGRSTRWEPLLSIDLPLFAFTPIKTIAWLPGSLLFATNGAQATVLSPGLTRRNYSSNICDVIRSVQAPLPDAHPENLVQCVLWDKFSLVKAELRKILTALQEDAAIDVDLAAIDVFGYLRQFSVTTKEDMTSALKRYRNRIADKNDEWQTLLSALTSSTEALKSLSGAGLYKLDAEDLRTLASLAKTMGYAEEQAQALDRNGRRFLMLFSTRSDRHSGMTHEDALWALHSESKEVCLQTVISQCPKELILWNDVRQNKISYWIDDVQMAALAESLARNHFVTEDRNPISTSIFYFALGKPKTVWGLWRQSAGHPERAAMLKFLQNNFEDPRWRTAAAKNAYALLGKQRFQYAAAFFLLGDCPKDAINVCIKHMRDYDLAVFIARIRHDRTVLLPWLIETHLLPKAREHEDKWLTHWCWWAQGKKQQAIEAIYDPEQRTPTDDQVSGQREPHDDAITMAVLLSDLKSRPESRTICTNVVSIEQEMEIVRSSAHRLRTIGCEALAFSVIAEWQFDASARAEMRRNARGHMNGQDKSLEDENATATYETRPMPKERSEKASVMAQGPVQDSAQTQGAMEFDMGAFF